MKIKIQCPAKINLSLKIINKRQDGFHNIESIMQTIDLYDYLTINVQSADKLEILLSGNSTEIPYDKTNLVYKAAELFFETVKLLPRKISIYIEKNIPVAAGLAGGSTDAAGTLFGLNEIFDKPLSNEKLHELCAKLGSDLNVCLQGGRLFCKGRGEIIEPMKFEEFNVSLIKPINLGISAKEAYTKYAQKIPSFDLGGEISDCGERKAHCNKTFLNDLEWAIIDDYIELQRIKNLYPESIMSGSGSTYFIINKDFEPLDGYQIFNSHKAINLGIKKVPQ